MAKGLIIVLWNGIVGDLIKIWIVASTVLSISEILWYIIEFRALLNPAGSVKASYPYVLRVQLKQNKSRIFKFSLLISEWIWLFERHTRLRFKLECDAKL